MARFDVTPELASIIKSTRIAHNITAKSVAEHIGKSQAYISKLEKGELKTINQDQLLDIFIFVLGSEEAFQDFLNNTLVSVFSTLTLRHSQKEIDKQIWYQNFDTVLRQIPIPESLVHNINEIISENNIDIDRLVNKINGNEEIKLIIDNIENYPENTWNYLVEDGETKQIFIRMHIKKNTVSDILSFQYKSTNYVNMLAIVFYSLVIIENSQNANISDETYKALKAKAIDILNRHRFFSLEEKYYLEKQAQNDQEREALISEFDKENSKTINEIIEVFRVFSDVDMLRTTNYLNQFKSNLKWDSGFVFEILNMPFDTLSNTNIEHRKKLLREIYDLIKGYASNPPDSNDAKFYD